MMEKIQKLDETFGMLANLTVNSLDDEMPKQSEDQIFDQRMKALYGKLGINKYSKKRTPSGKKKGFDKASVVLMKNELIKVKLDYLRYGLVVAKEICPPELLERLATYQSFCKRRGISPVPMPNMDFIISSL